ncbi:MAG: TolC family protein [candidate division NC10 bacterium]|nr:TolC family protein [candidate division NC10 bacterium]
MRRRMLMVILVLLAASPISQASAMDIASLLAAAREQPDIQEKELAVAEADLRVTEAYSALFPKLGLYGRYEDYSSPTNMRPFFPTEGNAAQGNSLEFSRTIARYGATAQMPLYVKALYTVADQLKLLKDKAVTAKQIDLVRKEATVVALNSLFTSLVRSDAALTGREASLQDALAMTERKVALGRAAEADRLKIQKALSDLAQQHNDLRMKILDVQRDLRKLTGIALDAPVPMRPIADVQPGPFLALRVLEADVAAAQKDVQRAQEQFYPTLSLEGGLSLNEGTAYNTGSHVERSYNFVALVLRIPLFDKTLFAANDIANVKVRRAEQTLEQNKRDLSALAQNLQDKGPVLARATAVAQEIVETQTRLLQIARVAYRNERLTTEEYLRYEADVLQAEAGLYQAQNDQWQVLAQQAVLYGMALTGVVQ